jgi:hypothetical protein
MLAETVAMLATMVWMLEAMMPGMMPEVTMLVVPMPT